MLTRFSIRQDAPEPFRTMAAPPLPVISMDRNLQSDECRYGGATLPIRRLTSGGGIKGGVGIVHLSRLQAYDL